MRVSTNINQYLLWKGFIPLIHPKITQPKNPGAVGLAYRRWRGRAGKTGFLLATAAGVGGFMAASQRWELKLCLHFFQGRKHEKKHQKLIEN
jgi:hypothetical protein